MRCSLQGTATQDLLARALETVFIPVDWGIHPAARDERVVNLSSLARHYIALKEKLLHEKRACEPGSTRRANLELDMSILHLLALREVCMKEDIPHSSIKIRLDGKAVIKK